MAPANTIEFATQEILCVHALCDRTGIPRKIEGELLSMSQRVAILELCYTELTSRLGMDCGPTHH